jgi:predicted PurR-regulated permease PerM
VDDIRPKQEARAPLVIRDPLPVDSVRSMWMTAGQVASIGVFLMLFGAFLSVGRSILLPITAATVIALTLGPVIKAAKSRGISPWFASVLIVMLSVGAIGLIATTLAGPIKEWIGRAPEIQETIRQKLSVLDQPIAAFHELEHTLFSSDDSVVSVKSPPNVVLPVVAFVTPALGELLIFFFALMFFLVGQIELRASLIALFGERDNKLRFLKIMRDIERNLAGYLTVVTLINATLGTIVALGTWLLGFPSPLIFGLLAALLNYVPYVGPAFNMLVLFGVGLVTFPSLGQALIAPLGFIALTTAEGYFITPTIVGRRLTLNPLLVFLSLVFWTWLWGPIGSLLAVPLLIIGLVVSNHLLPHEEIKLPE